MNRSLRTTGVTNSGNYETRFIYINVHFHIIVCGWRSPKVINHVVTHTYSLFPETDPFRTSPIPTYTRTYLVYRSLKPPRLPLWYLFAYGKLLSVFDILPPITAAFAANSVVYFIYIYTQAFFILFGYRVNGLQTRAGLSLSACARLKVNRFRGLRSSCQL